MQINAKARTEVGKQNKRLRIANMLPAVVMEKGHTSTSVLLDYVQFSKVYKEAGETSLIDFDLGGNTYKTLISEVQINPVTMHPIHAVFRKVDLKEKLTAQIPVEIVNEELNPLVKSGEAIVLKLLDEIAVEAFPQDLPKEFLIDASKIANIGDEIKISDLDYDRSKVEITDHDEEDPVVKLDKMEEMKAEEEVVITEEEALAQVTATEELSDEEKAKKEDEKKEEKGSK